MVLAFSLLFGSCLLFAIDISTAFTFDDNTAPTPDPQQQDPNSLQRQSVLPAPFIVTVTTTAATNVTCICVPTGTCNGTTAAVPTDGSGLLDPRIVTAAANVAVPPPVIAPGITCGTGLVSCCLPGPYQCGARYPPVANSPTPTTGQAPYGAYPWQAALLGPGDVYVASGVLINANNVVTVAHSVSTFATTPTSLKVRLGDWNAATTTEPIAAQDFIVGRIDLHPSYNNLNLKNDIAVLRLSTLVQLGQTPTIATACLPSIAFTGSRCWVSGWGRDAFSGGSFQPIMKQVDVPILQNTACQSELQATRLGAGFVFDTSSFLCAGGEVSKDACTGDGGAPLVCQLGTQWFVAGLVTWGIGCGTTVVPGVYVNMQTYLPWIQTTVAAA